MLAHPGKMYEYCKARRVLAQADSNSYPEGVWSYEQYSSMRSKKSSPVCFAVHSWLHRQLQGNHEANSVVIVSGQKISGPGACKESFEISAPPGPNVLVEVSAKSKTRGAPGGKKPPRDIQELPEVRKKGPYTWDVGVQLGGQLVKPLKLQVVVKWDTYHRPQHRPDLLYNHFRIDACNNVDGGELKPQCVQDWYNQVKAGDEVDQWLISDEVYGAELLADRELVQEMSHNTCTSQQQTPSYHPSNTETPLHSSGSNAKRARPSGTETLVPLEHCSSIPSEEFAQKLKQLENSVCNLSISFNGHSTDFATLKSEVGDLTDEVVHIHLRLDKKATANSQSSTASRTSLEVESSRFHSQGTQSSRSHQAQLTHSQLASSKAQLEPPTISGSLADVAAFDNMSDGAPSSRQHASPARSAAIIGKLGPCPPFDASLTNEQIKPYILKVLETTQQSRSPLHLSKTLWPEASTDLRHSMKVRVNSALYSLQCDGRAIKNSVDWSLAPSRMA